MPNSPKKIAVLLPSLHVGGAERLVLEELACLKNDSRFSFEVHLVFEKGPFYDKLVELDIPVHVWNAPHKSVHILKTYFDIIQHLRRTRCDIMHNHLLDHIGPIVGKLAETRVVATIHSDKQYSVAERFVLARSDLVLACGKQVMQNIQRFIPSEKVKVLNNAIHGPDNRGAHTGDLLREIGIKKGSRLVVSLGRLTRLKGYDLLIKAFKKVLVDMPDTVLLIGGDGEEKDRLIKLVESYGLKENIRLLGMVSEIHELLEACDLYVNSSRWEGLPMTLLEAMAHGKPMVATSVGGNPEVVLDGVTGILVQPDDPQGLANAIIRMMKDDAFRRKAGKAALSLFTQKYTIEKHCQTLAKYYLQVLKNNISASKVPETIINHNNS